MNATSLVPKNDLPDKATTYLFSFEEFIELSFSLEIQQYIFNWK